MSITQRVRRFAVAGMAGAMVLALMPAGVATAINHGDVCEDAPQTTFNDQSSISGAFTDYVNCMAAYGITVGTAAGNFEPGTSVNRQQMALFVARFVTQAESGNTDVPAAADAGFSDAGLATAEGRAAINYLSSRDIVQGFADNTYRPGAYVSRQQMASFIVRALDAIGADLPAGTDRFPDVHAGATHADNINALAQAQIVFGFADGTYRPAVPVTRQQMSQFIILGAAEAHEQGEWNGEYIDDDVVAPSVSLEADAFIVIPGDEVVVTFTGDVDRIESVSAAGECVDDDAVLVLDDGQVTITTDETFEGECVVTFTVTFDDDANTTQSLNVTLTTEEALIEAAEAAIAAATAAIDAGLVALEAATTEAEALAVADLEDSLRELADDAVAAAAATGDADLIAAAAALDATITELVDAAVAAAAQFAAVEALLIFAPTEFPLVGDELTAFEDLIGDLAAAFAVEIDPALIIAVNTATDQGLFDAAVQAIIDSLIGNGNG